MVVERNNTRSAEEKARLKAIRERFQLEKPTAAQLVAEHGYNEPVPHGDYVRLQQAVTALRKAREDAGLSLSQIAERSGIDKAALSRLETGRQINPTLATLSRYARALGKHLRWTIEDPSPDPDHVAGGNQGAPVAPDLTPTGTKAPRVSKKNPTVEAVTKAYVEVRGPELHSTDRVIADPDLDCRFLELCRRFGAAGTDFDLNWRLFNARKASQLGGIPKARKFSIARPELDHFLFASEIALRILLDDKAEQGLELSLDRVICDPELAKEFDKIARRLAPGFSPLQYRWGAFNLRKASRVQDEAQEAKPPEFSTVGFTRNLEMEDVPTAPGLYVIGEDEQPLFVCDTLNIRNRVERHFRYGGGHILPDWVLRGREPKRLTLGVCPMAGHSSHAIEVSEFRAKTCMHPPLNVCPEP
jgi:ribosome-binding protein aMBF1 (putative translation factor)